MSRSACTRARSSRSPARWARGAPRSSRRCSAAPTRRVSGDILVDGAATPTRARRAPPSPPASRSCPKIARGAAWSSTSPSPRTWRCLLGLADGDQAETIARARIDELRIRGRRRLAGRDAVGRQPAEGGARQVAAAGRRACCCSTSRPAASTSARARRSTRSSPSCAGAASPSCWRRRTCPRCSASPIASSSCARGAS